MLRQNKQAQIVDLDVTGTCKYIGYINSTGLCMHLYIQSMKNDMHLLHVLCSLSIVFALLYRMRCAVSIRLGLNGLILEMHNQGSFFSSLDWFVLNRIIHAILA